MELCWDNTIEFESAANYLFCRKNRLSYSREQTNSWLDTVKFNIQNSWFIRLLTRQTDDSPRPQSCICILQSAAAERVRTRLLKNGYIHKPLISSEKKFEIVRIQQIKWQQAANANYNG